MRKRGREREGGKGESGKEKREGEERVNIIC